MRKKLTPPQAFEHHVQTELPGLSAEHVGPLARVWQEATWHPHVMGQFTPEEKAQRFAARVQADLTAGRPYALALHAAGLDLGRVSEVVLQAHHAAATAIPFPWYVTLRLPGLVCGSSPGDWASKALTGQPEHSVTERDRGRPVRGFPTRKTP